MRVSLLDRYIARQYLVNVVALFLILFAFVVVIDASINLKQYTQIAVRLSAEAEAERLDLPRPRDDFRLSRFDAVVVTFRTVVDLWWPRLLQLYNFLLGTVMVTAMGFTCSQFVKNREFVAMLAAGQSLYRVGRPIVMVALLLTLVQAVNQEMVIPRVAHLLFRQNDEAGRSRAEADRILFQPDSAGRLWSAGAFDSRANTLRDVEIIERDAQRLATRRITASSAFWINGRWVLDGGRSDDISAATPAPVVAERPADGRDGAVDGIETSLSPEEIKLRVYQLYSRALAIHQLNAMLSRSDLLSAEEADRLRRIRWGRVSLMASGVLTLLIAMPFFVTREPRPMITQALKCAPVSGLTLAGSVLGASSAVPGLSPLASAFIPVMILTPLAFATVSSVRS